MFDEPPCELRTVASLNELYRPTVPVTFLNDRVGETSCRSMSRRRPRRSFRTYTQQKQKLVFVAGGLTHGHSEFKHTREPLKRPDTCFCSCFPAEAYPIVIPSFITQTNLFTKNTCVFQTNEPPEAYPMVIPSLSPTKSIHLHSFAFTNHSKFIHVCCKQSTGGFVIACSVIFNLIDHRL